MRHVHGNNNKTTLPPTVVHFPSEVALQLDLHGRTYFTEVMDGPNDGQQNGTAADNVENPVA